MVTDVTTLSLLLVYTTEAGLPDVALSMVTGHSALTYPAVNSARDMKKRWLLKIFPSMTRIHYAFEASKLSK
jgi:hypothetical protein